MACYNEQPLEIPYKVFSGRNVKGVPDFLVHYIPESMLTPLIVDVKYRKDLFKNWITLKPRLLAALNYARERGWRYKIMTEVEIVSDYLVNARFLLPFRRPQAFDSTLSDRVLELIRGLENASPVAVQQAHSNDRWKQAEILPALWHLVSVHVLYADLSIPLTMNTSICAVRT